MGLCWHLCQSTLELLAISNMNIFYGVVEDDKYHAEKSPREKGVEVFNFKQGFGGKPQ